MIPLSVLELGRVRHGFDRRTSLDNARTLAQHAERLGFRRFWVAEHHNSPAVTTAATSGDCPRWAQSAYRRHPGQ